MIRRPAIWAATVFASAALALSACGGDDSTTPADAAPPGGIAAGADPEQMQELQDCLDEQGVQLPSPDASGSAPSIDANTEKALQSCGRYLPDGSPASGVPPSSP